MSKASEKSNSAEPTGTSDNDREAFGKAGVPMPDSDYVLDNIEVSSAAAEARAKPGSRSPFDDFHNEAAPLLPVTGSTQLSLSPVAAVCETIDTDGNRDNDCVSGTASPSPTPTPTRTPTPTPSPTDCPDKVCATACASASATATAAAFAHASARACAFAYAWACVFDRMAPFNRVCSWASSEACASSFASAFGYGYATAQDQECKTVCSDGTSSTSRAP